MTDPAERRVRLPGWAPVVLVVLLLAGLPAAVWLDLRNISEHALVLQAENLNSLLTTVRNYYADDEPLRRQAAVLKDWPWAIDGCWAGSPSSRSLWFRHWRPPALGRLHRSSSSRPVRPICGSSVDSRYSG